MIERYKNRRGEEWQTITNGSQKILLQKMEENSSSIQTGAKDQTIECDFSAQNIGNTSYRIFVNQPRPQNTKRYWIRQQKNSFFISSHGFCMEIQIAEWRDCKSSQDKSLQALRLTMPGKVVDIKVKVGDIVEKGQCLLVVEAMKMENNLVALGRAKIEKILVEKGTRLESGATLITFTAP